jgi:hypothetical protein
LPPQAYWVRCHESLRRPVKTVIKQKQERLLIIEKRWTSRASKYVWPTMMLVKTHTNAGHGMAIVRQTEANV